jgi:hypothetical protein
MGADIQSVQYSNVWDDTNDYSFDIGQIANQSKLNFEETPEKMVAQLRTELSELITGEGSSYNSIA